MKHIALTLMVATLTGCTSVGWKDLTDAHSVKTVCRHQVVAQYWALKENPRISNIKFVVGIAKAHGATDRHVWLQYDLDGETRYLDNVATEVVAWREDTISRRYRKQFTYNSVDELPWKTLRLHADSHTPRPQKPNNMPTGRQRARGIR